MLSFRSLTVLAGASLISLATAVSPVAAAPVSSASPSYATSSGQQNWAGLYGGLHLGYMWGRFSGQSANVAGPIGTDASVTGGLQGGYNWQQDRLVLGGEVDFSLLPVKEGAIAGGSFEENWGSTLRGRAGYTFGKWLPYATAGLGLTNTDSKISGGSVNNTHVGYALGAGVDYAVFDNLSWRTEFLHVDVPEESDKIRNTNFKGGVGNNEIRIGANYRFH